MGNNDGGGDVGQPDDDNEPDTMDVEVDNPEPKPADTFLLANQVPVGRCVPPAAFPTQGTIFLKEGAPTDYVSDRGACAVLALLRNTGPKLITRTCTVSAPLVGALTLEITDDHLNTFSPVTRDVYIKAVLLVASSQDRSN